MSAELIAYLGADTENWTSGFKSANETLDEFAGHVDGSMARLADSGRKIGASSGFAAIAIRGLATGLSLVGGGAGGLVNVSSALFGISAAATNASTSISGLRRGTSYVQKLVGVIGGIGTIATVSALGLRGVSFAMSRMGQDTAKVDGVARALSRLALAATVTVVGIQGIRLGFSAMRATAGIAIGAVTASVRGLRSALALVPAAVSTSASAIARLGGAGMGVFRGAGMAFSSFAATAGDALGEVAKGAASVAMGFAFGGVVGGLATVAGLLVANAGSFRNLIVFSDETNKSLAEINGWFAGIGSWLQQIGSGLAGNGIGMLNSLLKKSSEYLESFLQATQPLTAAIQNVWLPAVTGSVDSAESRFSSFFEYLETNWGQWIFDGIQLLSEFIGNFDLYFQIAQQNIVLWASNAILQMGDFFANVGEWLLWFGDHWMEVFQDIGGITISVLTNLGTNFSRFFQSLLDFAKGNGFNFEAVGLLDGFESSISELPQLTKTELANMSPELESLYKQLGERQAAAREQGLGIAPEKVFAQGSGGEEDEAIKKSAGGDRLASAALRGSKEAFSTIVNAQANSNNPVVNATKEVVAEQKKSNQFLNKLAGSKSGASHPGPILDFGKV